MEPSSAFDLPPQPQPATAEQPVPAAGTPGKRGRGRPKKQIPQKAEVGEPAGDELPPVISVADASPRLVEEPLPVSGKRGRGRPRKNAPASGVGVGKPAGSGSGKRGRPKKSVATEDGPVDSAAGGVKRGRGRPKKIPEGNGAAVGAVQALGTGRPGVRYSERMRGRPSTAENAGDGGGGVVAVAGKKRGPPPGRKNRGRRPVGRPRKVGSSGPKEIGTFTEEDVLRKFEYMQMKIRDAIGMLRPQCGDSIPVTDAILELEGLASMDFSAVPLADPPAAAHPAPPVD